MKKKLIDIIKLEDRVLFDAAGATDIIAAAEAQAAAQQISETDARAAEEREALKNAPPESPVADHSAEAGNSADPSQVADVDAAVDALVEGGIPQDSTDHANADAADAADADDSGDAGVVVDQVDDMDAAGDANQAVDDFINLDSAEQDRADSDDPGFVDAFQAPAFEERELVIINSSVKDADKIIAALGDNTDVLYLEKGTDALDAINDFLDANGDVKYSAIHIVSHGNAGYFVLNGEVIDGEAVSNDPASWANIGEHLTDNGDIMLYACNLAGNEQGQLLVSQIASLTGADVAASVDSTGVHGNWDLEYSIGAIDNQFLQAVDYNYSLANVTLTVDGSGTSTDHFASFDEAYQFAISGADEYTIDIQINGAFATELDNADSITITGNGLTVNDSTVTGDLTFGNTSVTLSGTTDFSGTVNVNSNLILNGNVTTSGSGALTINGLMSGSGNITFDGSTILTGSNASVNMTGGTITYSALNGVILNGTYANLAINNSEMIANDLIFNGNVTTSGTGKLTINGEMSGTGNITFDGTHVVAGSNASVNMTGGTVVYTNAYQAGGVLGGRYYDLVLGDSAVANWTLDSSIGVTHELDAAQIGNMLTFAVTTLSDNTGTIVNAPATVVYNTTRAGNFSTILGGEYTNLTINGSSIFYSDTLVTRELQLPSTSANTMEIRSGGTLTVGAAGQLGNVVDTASVTYRVQAGGKLIYNLEGSKVKGLLYSYGETTLNIHNGAWQSGLRVNSGGKLTINGNNTTFYEVVGIGASGGSIDIVGTTLTFEKDVTNAVGWYIFDAYMKDDTTDYTGTGGKDGWLRIHEQSGVDLSNGLYNGTITVRSAGQVNFNGAVVSTGTFNIEQGTVVFGNSDRAFVAVAGGFFNISAGTYVTFGSNVYISAAYNSTRSTEFNVNGGTVEFNGDVRNWVRSWRGYYTVDGAGNKVIADSYETDLQLYRDSDGNLTQVGVRTDLTNSSTVNFNNGSKVSFKDSTTYANWGSFGIAATNVNDGASVTFSAVSNIAYKSVSTTTVQVIGGTLTWDSDTKALWGDKASSIQVNGNYNAVCTTASIFQLFASDTTFKESVINAGSGAAGSSGVYYIGYNPTLASSGFTITGSNNRFLGNVINDSLGKFSIGGHGNSFTNIMNGWDGVDSSYSSMSLVTVTGSQDSLGNVQNYGTLKITDAGTTKMALTNGIGGVTSITGNNDGFTFLGLTIAGGAVILGSDVGGNGITTDITLGAGAKFDIQARNDFSGKITNAGTIDINARNVSMSGLIDNSGSLNVNQFSIFTGEILNKGTFKIGGAAADMVFTEKITNSGEISIGSITTFVDMYNTASGKLNFTKATGSIAGAEGTTFVNLNNAGTLNVTVDRILFTKGLTNTGMLNIASGVTGTRFKEMVDPNGNIRFVNSGTLIISAASGADDYMDVNNSGTIEVSNNVNFASVINTGSIKVGNTGTLNFYGSLVNDNVISGAGNVNLYFAVYGNGSFDMSASSKVLYSYDGSNSQGNTTCYIDSDGNWRIGGQVVGDAYSNRPVYDARYGWVLPGSNVVISNFNEYVDVTVSGGIWYVGGVSTGKSAVLLTFGGSQAAPYQDDATGSWHYYELNINGQVVAFDTGIEMAQGQTIFSGKFVNLTVTGDATLADGVRGLTLAGNSAINGRFSNTGMRISVTGFVAFNGEYFDDAASSLYIAQSGVAHFNVITSDPVTGRRMATVLGTVNNDGVLEVAANKALNLMAMTTGAGSVRAQDAMVRYGSDAAQVVFNTATNNGGYGELEFTGSSSKLLGGDVVTGTLLNNAGVAIDNGGSLEVRLSASGTGNYFVGTESLLVFNAGNSNYTILGDISVSEQAFGIRFNGSTLGRITVAGTLLNYSIAGSGGEVRRIGVVAGNTAFNERIENNGTFTVINSGVSFRDFVQNGAEGSQLIFDIGAGNAFAVDGSGNKITGNGGVIVIASGEVVVSGTKIVSGSGENQSAFQVNANAVLVLNADGQVLPQVTVDFGGALKVTDNAVIGRAGEFQNGLTLNGDLTVDGNGNRIELTVYGYRTGNTESPTAYMYVGNNAILSFVDDINYGAVYGLIEIAGGKLTGYKDVPENVRLTTAKIDDWIVINAGETRNTSDWNHDFGDLKFLVLDGGKLIVDTGSEIAYRLQGNAELVISIDTVASGEVTAGAGSSITVNGGVTAGFGENGTVTILGSITGAGSLVFDGKVVTFDAVSGAAGHVNMESASSVTYGRNAGNSLFAGTYGTLVVDNVASVGNVTILTALLGTGSVTFAGETYGESATVGNMASTGTLNVTYGAKALTVYGGRYASLTFESAHTVNAGNSAERNITVDGAFSITGGSAASPVKLTLHNTNLVLNGAVLNTGSATLDVSGEIGTVTYNTAFDQAIYSGTYRNLVISGTGTRSAENLNIKTTLSGNGTLEINNISGSGSVEGDGAGNFLNVSYGSNVTSGFLAGTYGNLTLGNTGAKTIVDKIIVNGNMQASGAIFGTGELVFNGRVLGSAVFGSIDTAYVGSVTYAQADSSTTQNIYGGYYTSLVISGNNKTVASDLTVNRKLTTDSGMTVARGYTVDLNEIAASDNVQFTVSVDATLKFSTVTGGNVVAFKNDGTLVAEANYSFGADLVNNGTLQVRTGATVTVTGTAVLGAASNYNIQTGGKLYFAGVGSGSSAMTIGNVIADGAFYLNDSVLVMAGTLTGNGTVSVGDTAGAHLTLAGQNSSLGGRLMLYNGSTLDVTGSARFEDLYTRGTIKVGTESGNGALLTLYRVDAGGASSSSRMKVNYNSTLTFDPYIVYQMIGGIVEEGKNGKVDYDPAFTGFYNLVTYWITIDTDTTMGQGDFSADHGYKIAGNVTLTLDSTVTTVSSELWLTEGSAVQVATGSGVVTLAGNVTNHGTISTVRDLAFTGGLYVDNTVTRDAGDTSSVAGKLIAANDTTVSYNSSTGLVFDGTYYNLALAGNNSVADFRLNGTMTGAGALVVTGLVAGSGTVDMTGSVTYAESAGGAILSGNYGTLRLIGNKNLSGSITTDTLEVVSGAAGEAVVLSGNGSLTVNRGLVTAAGTTITHTGTVTYGTAFTGEMLSGSYDNLIVDGLGSATGNMAIANLTVNGKATFSGSTDISSSINGVGTLVFSGAVAGNAVVGDVAQSGTLSVQYSGAEAGQIFAGRYGNLVIFNGDRTLAGDTTVDGYVSLASVLNGTANLTLNGSVTGAGTVNMTGGTVTYSATSGGTVYGGVYAGLTVADSGAARVFGGNLVVSGAANLAGAIGSGATVTLEFNGATSGNAVLNIAGGNAVYGESAGLAFAGVYNNLTLSGDKSFSNGETVVTGTLTVDGSEYVIGADSTLRLMGTVADQTTTSFKNAGSMILGGRSVTIAGSILNNGTFELTSNVSSATINAFTANVGSTVVLNGKVAFATFDNYIDFALTSKNVTFGTFNNHSGATLRLQLNDGGSYTFADTQKLVNDGAVVVEAGKLVLTAFSEGTEGGVKNYTVKAGAGLTLSAANLVLEGSMDVAANATLTVGDSITFNGLVALSGVMNGSGTATFNGMTTGDGRVDGMSAVYSEAAGTVFSGTYGALTVTGNKMLNNAYIIVTGDAKIDGTLFGSGALTFNGKTEGNGYIAQGSVISATYAKDAATIYGGYYWNLSITGSRTIDSFIQVDGDFSLYAVDSKTASKLSGEGRWVFNGSVYSNLAGNTIENTNTVEYNGSGSSILSGVYKNLVVNGNRSVGDITLNGKLSGNGLLHFTGTTTAGADAVVVGISAEYGEKATVVFAGTYGDLTLQGSKALSGEKITVNGDLSVQRTAKGAISVISGTSELVINGVLVGFAGDADNRSGQFDYTGKITLNGNGISGSNNITGSTFNGALVINGTQTINGNSVLNGEISGTGNLTLNQSVTGSATFNMKDGSTVTYGADMATLFSGTYYNLVLQADGSHRTRTIANSIAVNNLLTVSGIYDTIFIAEGGKLAVRAISDSLGTEYVIHSGGTMIFGSESDKIGDPDTRVTVNGLVNNYGTLTVNRNGYTFRAVYNNKGGLFNVTDKVSSSNSDANTIILNSFYNEFGATANFRGSTRIEQLAGSNGWTNYGTLTIANYDNFGFSDPAVKLGFVNSVNAEFTVERASYTFNSTDRLLVNGGTVKAGAYSTITLNGIVELEGGNMKYVVANYGEMTFAFENTSWNQSVLNNGLRGSLTNNGGVMNLNTANQKYYGEIVNDGTNAVGAYFNVNARSIFEGAMVRNSYGIVTIAAEAAGTVFQKSVETGSVFLIYGSTTFGDTVTVQHSFLINAKTVFNGAVLVWAGDGNDDTNTQFVINAETTFNGTFTNRNSSDAAFWNTVVYVNATTKFNGAVVNEAVNAGHFAEIQVNSNNNVFSSLKNSGSGSKFIINGSYSTFAGAISNAGLFELNGINYLSDFTNAATGYLRINNTASGSSIGALDNSGRVTVFAGENGESTVIDFNKAVTNSGTFTIEAEGLSFKQAVTNSGVFNVMASTLFNAAVTNSGEFNIKADGTTFMRAVENTGSMTVAQGVSGVKFNGAYTLGTGAHLYLNGADTVFNGAFSNSGTIHVTGNDGENGLGNIINGVLTMMSGSAIEVGGNGELTLNVVNDLVQPTTTTTVTTETTEAADGITTVTSTENGVTTTVVTVVANGVATITTTVVSNGVQPVMTVADGGILRFNKQSSVQNIYSHIVVSGDGVVDYTEGWTIFHDIEYLDWIIISSNVTLTDITVGGKYRVIGGGVLTINGSVAGSIFKVTEGGLIIFNTNVSDVGSVNITVGGSAVVNSGNFTGEFNNLGGVVNVNGNDVTFSKFYADGGTTNINGAGVSFGTFEAYDAITNVNGNNVSFELFANFAGALTINGDSARFGELDNAGLLTINGSNGKFDQLYNGWFNSETQTKYTGTTVINGQNVFVGGGLNIGTLTVSKGASVTLTEFHDRFVNQDVFPLDEYYGTTIVAGTVTLDAGQFIDFGFAGTVIAEGGKFISSSNILFAGATSGSADFSEAASVTYGGWMGQNQTIISGTYNDLLIGFGENFPAGGGIKTMVGTVTVNGTFSLIEQGSLVIAANGVLNLNAVAQTGGEGGFTNNGTVNFNKAGQTVNGTFVNNGTIGIYVSDIAFSDLTNAGTVAVNGNDVNLKLDSNSGSIIVNGNNANLTGSNTATGNIVINGQNANMGMGSVAGTQITVNAAGSMNLVAGAVDNGRLNASVSNNGTVSIQATVTDFVGGFSNLGKMDFAAAAAGSNATGVINTAKGVITVHAASVTLGGLDQSGRVELYTSDTVLNGLVNKGTLALQVGGISFKQVDNAAGKIELNADYTISQTDETNGTVVNNKTLTFTGDAMSGTYVNNGAMNLTQADVSINGVLDNAGKITAQNVTFTGTTSGSGTVNADSARYTGNAALVYGGAYNELFIDTAASVLNGNAVVQDKIQLDSKLTVNGLLNIVGATAGNGMIAGGKGTVEYSGADQNIIRGNYNNITLSGTGTKTAREDLTISGNAKRADSVNFVSTAAVNYNGTGNQQTMSGKYNNLTLSGSGSKLMEGGEIYTANQFHSNGGSWNNMLQVGSDNGQRWTLDAGSADIHYTKISDADSTKSIYLDGTNLTGSNNSSRWLVFDSAGGIGDSFPSESNLNFSALALILGDELRGLGLEVLYSQGDIYFQRRIKPALPVDEVSTALEEVPNFIDDRLQYDEIVFDDADFNDQDYSDILDVADIFTDELNAAIDSIVTE